MLQSAAGISLPNTRCTETATTFPNKIKNGRTTAVGPWYLFPCPMWTSGLAVTNTAPLATKMELHLCTFVRRHDHTGY